MTSKMKPLIGFNFNAEFLRFWLAQRQPKMRRSSHAGMFVKGENEMISDPWSKGRLE